MREWLRRWLGLEQDRRECIAAAKGLVEPLWMRLNELEKGAEPAEVEDPITCPSDPSHTGLLKVTTLTETDVRTLAERPVGGGYYCPRCGKSFYFQNGRKWAVEGSTVEVEQGVPQDTPRGVRRDPEKRERRLKFRP